MSDKIFFAMIDYDEGPEVFQAVRIFLSISMI